MRKEIECRDCGKHMGVIRDASIRRGMVVLCAECDKRRSPDVPDFMRGLFR